MRPGTSAREAVAPSISSRISASAITMNSAELVNAISCPPIRASGKKFLISNWWIGSMRPSVPSSCRSVRRAVCASAVLFRIRRVQLVRPNHPCRPHHVENTRGEAEQQKHDHSPRRNSQATSRAASRCRHRPERPRRARSKAGSRGRSPTDRRSDGDARLTVGGTAAIEWPSRSPRRWNRAESAASSVGGCLRSSSVCRARRRPCFRHPQSITERSRQFRRP